MEEEVSEMNDMTSGSPMKTIVCFSIPLIIGNLFQLLYNMVDTFIVGRTMGVEALAGIGLAGGLTFLVIGFAQGFTAGTAIPLAQAYGAKNFKKVKRSVALNLVLAVGVSLVLTVISTYFLWDLLLWMKTPATIIQYAYDYILVIFLGMVVTVFFNMLSNLLRAIGDSRTPVVALMVTTLINIVLDYVFIVYFHWGVAGAAIATVIAQMIAIFICLYVIKKDIYILQVEGKDFQVKQDELVQHFRLGIPMGFQASIIAIGSVSVSIALNTLGADAVAGYSAANRVDQLVIQVLMSFGIAMATYVGQNYGAGQYGRIIVGVKQTALLSVFISVFFGILFMFTGGNLTAIFGDAAAKEVLASYGHQFFLWTGPFYCLLALLFVFRYTLQGLNDSLTPTLAGLMELLMRVLAAFILTPLLGFTGTVVSNPLAWFGSLAVLAPAYLIKYRQLKSLEAEEEEAGLELEIQSS